MEGKPDPPHLRGIIPNSFQHIFEHVNSAKDQQFLIRASYLEIYNEEIRDLLSKTPKVGLELKENVDSGVYVKDLSSFVVKNVAGASFSSSLFLVFVVECRVLLEFTIFTNGVCNNHHLFSLPLAPLHRNRPRDAVGQDESLHRRHGDEPNLFSQSQYLHHRGGVRRVRCQV